MQVNFDATEPVNEEIVNDKQVIPFAQYAVSRAIDHFVNRKFTEAATVCYKAHCLLDYLRFVLPTYPKFASIYSFANIFLASAQNVKNYMLCERFFQTPVDNARDAFFDPAYSFVDQFNSVPAEFCADLQGKIAETLFCEVKRILMRQRKTGRVALEGNRILFKIGGFQGEFQWAADFRKNLQEAHELVSVEEYDRLRIVFQQVQAHPVDEHLALFAGSLAFELDDKYGEQGAIFEEIRDKINQLVIAKQLHRIAHDPVPAQFDGTLFAFTRAYDITLDAIKTRAQRPVYALVYRFPKEMQPIYANFAEQNDAVFASKCSSFADLACQRAGKPTIRLESLSKQKGPSDYLIFYFKQQYEQNAAITCGPDLVLSFRNEETYPEAVMSRLISRLANLQQDEYRKELCNVLREDIDRYGITMIYQEDCVYLCAGRLNVRVIDKTTVELTDFLTGDDMWALYDGFYNSGPLCMTQPYLPRTDGKLRMLTFLQEYPLLFLYELADLNRVVSEITYKHIIFNVFYTYIDAQVQKPRFGYFYQNNEYLVYVYYTIKQVEQTIFYYDYFVEGYLHVYNQQVVNAYEFFADVSAKVAKIPNYRLQLVEDSYNGIAVTVRASGGHQYIVMPQKRNPTVFDYQMCKNCIVAVMRKIMFINWVQASYLRDPFDNFVGGTAEYRPTTSAQFKQFSQEALINYIVNNDMARFLGIVANKDILVANIEQYLDAEPKFADLLIILYFYIFDERTTLSSNLQLSFPRFRYAPYAPFFEDTESALRVARNLSSNYIEPSDVALLLADVRNLICVSMETDVVLCSGNGTQHILFRYSIEDLRRALREQLRVQLYYLYKKSKNKQEVDASVALFQQYHADLLARLESLSYQTWFSRSAQLCSVSRLDNDFEYLDRSASRFQAFRGVALRQVLQADGSDKGIHSLMCYTANYPSAVFCFTWDANYLLTHDYHLRAYAYEQYFIIQHRIHTMLYNQAPIHTQFQFKQRMEPVVLRLRDVKPPEMYGSKLRFQTRSATFAYFMVDLGGLDQPQFVYFFDPPSISLSLNTKLVYQDMEIDVSKVLKTIVRRFSCGMFFYNSNEPSLFTAPNLNIFEQAQTRFICGEKPVRCECVNCVVSDKQILNYYNKCRCGDHHCAPFGHGMLTIPTFKESLGSARYLDAIIKVEKIASTLNYLQASYELCGQLRLFLRIDSTIAGRDSDNVKFLTIKGFDWLRINASYDNPSCLYAGKQRYFADTDVNQLVALQFGFHGVVFGTTCYGWEGQVLYLKDGKWVSDDGQQIHQDENQ